MIAARSVDQFVLSVVTCAWVGDAPSATRVAMFAATVAAAVTAAELSVFAVAAGIAGGKVFSISYHGGDGNDVVLTEHGNAIGHAVHHASAMTAADWLFT